MTVNVKCCDCGFLAVRNKQTRQLMEAELEIRANHETKDTIYELLPICFRMEEQLEDDISQLKRGTKLAGKTGISWIDISMVTDRYRDCISFTKWQQGWTPREHFDMDLMKEQKNQENIRNSVNHRWRIAEFVALVIIVPVVTVITQFMTAHIQAKATYDAAVMAMKDSSKASTADEKTAVEERASQEAKGGPAIVGPPKLPKTPVDPLPSDATSPEKK